MEISPRDNKAKKGTVKKVPFYIDMMNKKMLYIKYPARIPSAAERQIIIMG